MILHANNAAEVNRPILLHGWSRGLFSVVAVTRIAAIVGPLLWFNRNTGILVVAYRLDSESEARCQHCKFFLTKSSSTRNESTVRYHRRRRRRRCRRRRRYYHHRHSHCCNCNYY